MRLTKGMSRTLIGIDVGERYIKATQLTDAGADRRIAAAGCFARTEPSTPIGQAEVRRLRKMLNEGGFKGNSIVLAVPNEDLLTGIMELPPRESGAPIEQLTRSELARIHNCQAQSFEMACWDLPATARATSSTFVMAAACKHAKADNLLDAFENEGFDVRALDMPAAATARACQPLLGDQSGTSAVLDIGWASSRLALLHQGVIVYERNLAASGTAALINAVGSQSSGNDEQAERLIWQVGADSASDQAPARAAQATIAEHFRAMAEEMAIPLSYVANQYPHAPMNSLVLVGGGATIPQAGEHLGEVFDFDVQVAVPSKLAQCSETFDKKYGSSLIAAIGLSEYVGR